MPLLMKKICLIGDFGVGKTSLIRQFVENQFSDDYLTTVGMKLSRKPVDVDGKKVQLLIWDIAGDTSFERIAKSYLKGSHGAIIIGDLTRSQTIEAIADHIKLFLSINPRGHTIVAFNKVDLVDKDSIVVPTEFDEGARVVATYHTSAKTGEYVDEIFEVLAKNMVI